MTYETSAREFSRAFNQPLDNTGTTEDLLALRYKLLFEEVIELRNEMAIAMAESHFKDGIQPKTWERLLKELADVQYVVSGLAVTFGLPLEEAFNRVHKSNMSKLGEDGTPIYREDGKVLKGPNYAPPDLEDLVTKYAAIPGTEYWISE